MRRLSHCYPECGSLFDVFTVVEDWRPFLLSLVVALLLSCLIIEGIEACIKHHGQHKK